jgi:hypothetical protein
MVQGWHHQGFSCHSERGVSFSDVKQSLTMQPPFSSRATLLRHNAGPWDGCFIRHNSGGLESLVLVGRQYAANGLLEAAGSEPLGLP